MLGLWLELDLRLGLVLGLELGIGCLMCVRCGVTVECVEARLEVLPYAYTEPLIPGNDRKSMIDVR